MENVWESDFLNGLNLTFFFVVCASKNSLSEKPEKN